MLSERTTKNLNVFMLGLSFLGLFAANYTMTNLQQTIIDSAMDNSTSDDPNSGYVEGFTASAFVWLATAYAVFAVFCWTAPSVMAILGLKLTMFLGSLTYALYVTSFFYMTNWFYYFTAVVNGIGAGLLWPASGAFLTDNSDKSTVARNSGFFYAMLQGSMLVGNLFAYFQFRGLDSIDRITRLQTIGGLFASTVAGCLLFILLLPLPGHKRGRGFCAAFWILPEKGLDVKADVAKSLEAMKTSFKLLKTENILLLSVYTVYSGILLGFWSGVYGTALSRTEGFEDPKSMPGLHGIVCGTGEIIGGLVIGGMLAKWTNRAGRWPVVMLGLVCTIAACVLILLNIPNDALLDADGSDEVGVINPPSEAVALTCSFLLGLGDAAGSTQMTSILGGLYKDDPGPAFAILKSVLAVASCISLFYTGALPLDVQISILIVTALLGSACFAWVDVKSRRRERAEEAEAKEQQNSYGAIDK